MRIWDLEREYQDLLAFVLEGRDKKRGSIKGAVEALKGELFRKGERALVEFSLRWDRWDREYPLKVGAEELEAGARGVSKADLQILKGMIRNVTAYHRGQKPKGRTHKRKGLWARDSFVPMESALVYVPGGTAAYPSSLIMGVVPAQIAGVKEVIVTTPATGGTINPYTCAASQMLGVSEVYRIGGAQAIYAFSFGIGVPKVDIIVGPGNAYVEEAKRDVYGKVGIDMLAGPTELLILCTEPFSPEAIARDMLSQAEHDELAMVGLFSSSRRHLGAVDKILKRLIPDSPRRKVMEKAIKENSFMAYYRDADKAIAAANAIAPEHMELIGDEALAEKILYPGILYLGPHTTVAMGDYCIGTNHVLPTAGAGRFTAGLSVDRFMRRKVVVKIEKEFLGACGNSAIRLSEIEGLYAHGEAVRARKEL
jgi:histidinol dehydrogenase